MELQPELVREITDKKCYNNLAMMLGLPQIEDSEERYAYSIETMIPFEPPADSKTGKIFSGSKVSASSSTTVRSASFSQQNSDFTSTLPENKKSLDELSNLQSDYVEVEKKLSSGHELIQKHKAILKFLGLPEVEAATWRLKETKDVSELSEMTLEEQGDFLINKIAVDFCEWLRELGGSEKSFINEEILKELFQIGMDNPASRAICIKHKEKTVLYYKLAEFLKVPKKSFQEVLSYHLKWDVQMEKMPSKLKAFGKGLPKDMQFKTPKNNTSDTWLGWNRMTEEQLGFAEVYSTIKDLRSTNEYCKWLKKHPELKRPQYLEDQVMLGVSSLVRGTSIDINEPAYI